MVVMFLFFPITHLVQNGFIKYTRHEHLSRSLSHSHEISERVQKLTSTEMFMFLLHVKGYCR